MKLIELKKNTAKADRYACEGYYIEVSKKEAMAIITSLVKQLDEEGANPFNDRFDSDITHIDEKEKKSHSWLAIAVTL